MAESVSFFSESDLGGQLYVMPEDYLADPLYCLVESASPGEDPAGGAAVPDQEPVKNPGGGA